MLTKSTKPSRVRSRLPSENIHNFVKIITSAGWDLVCGQSFLSELSQTIFTVGLMFGSVVFPPLADRFGRWKVIMSNHAVFVALTVATAFVPNIWIFLASRFLYGASLSGAGVVSWVVTLELCTARNRTNVALVSNLVWAITTCALPSIGYIMDGYSWRYVQLVFTIYSVVWIGQFLYMSESIRWLLANGRRKRAFRIVRKVAKVNRTDDDIVSTIATDFFSEIASDYVKPNTAIAGPLVFEDTDQRPMEKFREQQIEIDTGRKADVSMVDVIRHPSLRKATAIMCLAWFGNSVTYYGIYMLSSTMFGSRYLNLFLNSVVEIPSALILLPILHRFGRRNPCVCLHALAGIFLITAAVLDVTTEGDVASIIKTCVVVLGKFSISATFMVIYMYTPELFPTNIRSFGIGLADIAGRVGGFVAPFAATLARAVPWAPVCVFGALCFLISFFAMFLPETANRDLPQTLDDVVKMSQVKNEKPKSVSTLENKVI